VLGVLALLAPLAARGAPAPPQITSGPEGATNQRTARFEFRHPDRNVRLRCKGPRQSEFSRCRSPAVYTGLPDGSYTFAVLASDDTGDSPPVERNWRVDTVRPNTTIASGPPRLTNSTSATFNFTSTEEGSTFECSRDGTSFAPCSSPRTYPGPLGNGAHFFRVRATDRAGNPDQAAARYDWAIDTVAPETSITSAPAATSTAASVTFEFSSPEAGTTFSCSLDGADFDPCVSPRAYGGLRNGTHGFQVRGTDAAGNTDTSPASHSWTVNVAGPPGPPPVDRTPTGNVSQVKKVVRYRLLTLRWKKPAAPDFDHVVVRVGKNPRRTPRTQVYRGPGTTYANRRFQNGTYHRYAITSYDRAGNASRRVSVVVPASALLGAPRVGARVASPPLLDWASVPKATFYNVQLWIGSRKILTAWPTRSSFKLRRAWAYRDGINRLKRGSYRWYVWPGFGPRSKFRYGHVLGNSSFVVTR
jgi:hypothetical protein